MAVISLSRHDRRLERHITASLPGQEQLAEYLTRRLQALGGNKRVANNILIKLAGFRDAPQVTEEMVERLGVDHDEVRMKRLTDWYGHENELDTHMVGLSLHLHVMARPKKDDNTPGGVNPDHVLKFVQVFVCAYAMLSGIEFDPRQEAA